MQFLARSSAALHGQEADDILLDVTPVNVMIAGLPTLSTKGTKVTLYLRAATCRECGWVVRRLIGRFC